MARKIIKTAFGVVGGAVNGILGLKKKKAAEPEDGPKIMPLPDDEAVKQARKRSIAAQMQRGGRASTLLSDSSDTLG